MQLVGRNIKFSDDVKAIIRAELATGRYVYEDEVVTAVLYLLLQDMANKGEATETSRAVLRPAARRNPGRAAADPRRESRAASKPSRVNFPGIWVLPHF
jgi:Arc/MetJ-type ribon-helix-helix transcriptional regulator